MSFARLAVAVGALGGLATCALCRAAGPDWLVSRPLPPQTAMKGLPVGEEVRTAAGERRRFDLPGGAVVLVNEKTVLKRTGERALELSAGEIFVAAGAPGEVAVPLTVRAPRREVKTTVGRFAVRTDTKDSIVVAASGTVSVSGLDAPLTVGQQLEAGAKRPSTAPRVSQVLSWTRELMTDGMVPPSSHQGGSLVVLGSEGQEQRLALRRYHVDVHVEDGFARTTIDQTYFNHTHSRQEGTFRFPLPPGASLSRLAMYVDGKLNEGDMVEKDYGRMVYERIKYEQRDPALLEWIDGSTFSMRVFPLEPRQEKRILLSYTQRLGSLNGLGAYRFPAGHDLTAQQFSVHVRVKGGGKAGWQSASHSFKESKDGDDLVLDTSAKNAHIDRDVVFNVADGAAKEAARFSSAEQDGVKYLMLRFRPPLPSRAKRAPRDWIFLVESSGDRDPVTARTQIEIVRGMLQAAGPEDRVVVLTAGTRVQATAYAGPVSLTPQRVQQAVEWMEQSHLIGALDLGQALKLDAIRRDDVKNAWLVHVGSGIAAMGERRDSELVGRIPSGTRYVGIGVGRRWNRSYMKLAAEKTGGYFTQINPDEPVAWRAFDLAATLDTPRLLDIKVADRDSKVTCLPFTTVVAQGEELAAVARLETEDKVPETVVVSGNLDGKPYRQEVKVEDVKAKADYLPRTWAKLEIDRLLAEDPVKHKPRIIELSKAMYVMTPFTSLLVLENDEMYQQFKVDRGRKDNWAGYPAPDRIEVVYEPEDGPPFDPHKGIKPSPEQVGKTILVRDVPRVLVPGTELRRQVPPPTLSRIPSFSRPEVETVMGVTILRSTGDPRMHRQGVWGGLPGRLNVAEQEGPPATFNSTDAFAPSDRLPPLPVPALPGIGQIVLTGSDATRSSVALRNTPRADLRFTAKFDSNGLAQGKLRPASAGDATEGPFSIWAGFFDGSASVTSALLPRPADPNLSQVPLYSRPLYDDRADLYYNLLAHAPGLSTTEADVLSALEQEAAGGSAKPGVIEDGVRQLFDHARAEPWRSLALPGEGNWTIVFDGAGRYAWDRRLPSGLQEKVIGDGKNLWHLYPEIGLAARRSVGRSHRLAFLSLVPWALPLPEDLARGADLRLRGKRVVAVVLHDSDNRAEGKPRCYRELQFLFTEEKGIAGRRLVEFPSGKTLFQEELTPDGTLRRLADDGKEVAVVKGKLTSVKPPSLRPDIEGLVVLPLPYRTPEHVQQTLSIAKKGLESLTFDEGHALLAAQFAADNGEEALRIFRECFHRRDQRQIGYYVLLAACGQNLDAEHVDVLSEHRDSPLAQYLALYSSPVLRKHASQWATASNPWGDGFIGRLAAAHSHCQRWSDRNIDVTKKAELERALVFVRRHKGSAFGWAVLGLVADRAANAEDRHRDMRGVHQALAEAWPLFAEIPALHYFSRYEEARSLWKGGEGKRAAKLFFDLYEEVLAEGNLPPIDGDFPKVLLEASAPSGAWSELLRTTTNRLVKKGQREALLALARQCWQIGDEAASQRVYDALRDSLPITKESVPRMAASLNFLEETGQLTAADELLQAFSRAPELANDARVLRRAYQLAQRRNLPRQELEYLERLLDTELQHPADIVDLEAVRREYGDLLRRYEEQAEALRSLGRPIPWDFKPKVGRTADRWRALDRDSDEPCEVAARILRGVGDSSQAWDYLTTPISRRPNEPGPWADLAATLQKQGDWALADNAYAAAYDADPTNAQVLWDRARNLTLSGRLDQAKPLYRRLADGPWPPQYRGLQEQARLQAANR